MIEIKIEKSEYAPVKFIVTETIADKLENAINEQCRKLREEQDAITEDENRDIEGANAIDFILAGVENQLKNNNERFMAFLMSELNYNASYGSGLTYMGYQFKIKNAGTINHTWVAKVASELKKAIQEYSRSNSQKNNLNDIVSLPEFAEITGHGRKKLRAMLPELIEVNVAKKSGKTILIDKVECENYLKQRADERKKK